MEKFITVTNHPVHIKEKNGQLSPTALIPFCEFGGEISTMGVKIDQFEVPFCNSFKAKTLNDQLCYEIDPNNYKMFLSKKEQISLTLYINYNEVRQFYEDMNADLSDDQNFIIIGSIGNFVFWIFPI